VLAPLVYALIDECMIDRVGSNGNVRVTDAYAPQSA
jgi:hypothetical protein